MAYPVGPNAPSDHTGLLTKVTAQVTVALLDILAATYFNAGIIRRVVPQANGTVFLQRVGDLAAGNGAFSYVAQTGVPIDGEFVLIGGSTNYPTASAIVLSLEM